MFCVVKEEEERNRSEERLLTSSLAGSGGSSHLGRHVSFAPFHDPSQPNFTQPPSEVGIYLCIYLIPTALRHSYSIEHIQFFCVNILCAVLHSMKYVLRDLRYNGGAKSESTHFPRQSNSLRGRIRQRTYALQLHSSSALLDTYRRRP